ncbi:hypothetical protein T4A_2180 [Trichinella pseudospiralis]|uniref:Uncharacterized protein n=2 Tax=Trichinella pseudospiralis TaxID=6337 RepID=A0A0V1DRQ5_TRIPS|nr:hypothetical protein T4A_9466 [Trichinella pseudospiralis]KRY64299.1 hypothetical protein T4A_14045 [Trichinella pseudospiralis]KRY64304.1 hypothetical protein T4A_2180 [Trichinella pseudospiralis]
MNKRKSENARTRVKEADRGRHEAELCNEDIRYMWFPKGPNFVTEDWLDGEDTIYRSRV